MRRSAVLLALTIACSIAVALQPPQTGPATEKRFPPLKVPAGFKATLFACDPLIEYPSVIATGPKPGAIFVAIDYMTGLGSDGKVKSEIRLVEDTDGDGYADKATLVAGGFNSIQGLAYHDGTLFVMHAPFLTAIRGKERKDILSGLGLPPEQNSSRLHCANGVVIGHAGWLYLALGDNGIDVPRPEGDRLIHRGGAILRCRPDGRDLHVFSTGLRNIYDIALDAELNVFTRDNENDGGTYMIRVCHSFFGADHGYPYHYERLKDEALPPLGDFGLGSSAGGACYLERQFPPAYRGNLFFCEWGKSVVRYELKRTTSGFAPVKEFEFAAGDPKDPYPFKPTDIVIQRDGTMMVSDYADGQRPKRGRGRIYHIAHVGKDSAKPSAKSLDSESYFERCEAQAALERVGKKPSFAGLGPRGRLHAIWALVKISGRDAIDDLLQIAKSDPEPTVRAQAIRALADLSDPVLVAHKLDVGAGDTRLAEKIAALSEGQDPRVVLEAVVALGRLRWAESPDWMRRNLGKPDPTLAHAWMQTLRRSQAWPAIVKLLDDSATHPIAMRSLAERYEPTVVDGLIERLRDEKSRAGLREYADLLARVHRKPGPWKYWGYRPGPRPANTEPWERTEAIRQALEKALSDDDLDFRAAVLTSMQREKIPVSVKTLGDWLGRDFQNVRVTAILASLAELPPEAAREPLRGVVLERKHSDENRLIALERLAKIDGRELAALGKTLEDGAVLAEVLRRLSSHADGVPTNLFLSKLRSPDARVRAAAIEALGEARTMVQEGEMMILLADKDVRVRRAAAAAAGKIPVKGVVERLLQMANDADLGQRLACLQSLHRLKEPRVVPLALRGLQERGLELSALACLHDLGGPEHASAIAEFARHTPSTEGMHAAIRALQSYHDRASATASQRRELESAIAAIQGANGALIQWQASTQIPAQARGEVLRLATSGKHPDSWRNLFATGAEGRLTLAPAKDAKDSLWFALTDVNVTVSTSVEFLGSSRGGLEVWLNGTSIHRRASPAKFVVDSDRFAAALAKGTNRILVEASAPDGAVEFQLRFRRKSAKAVHEKLTQATLSRTGNADRGRKLFMDKEKSLCLKCHQVAGVGERIGPELTGVGGRFSRIYLVESILEPSRAIAPSFGTVVVALKNGKTINGVRVAETEKVLTLADNQGQKHEIAKANIEERGASPVSIMPDALEQRFSEDEFVDLIAFLANQK